MMSQRARERDTGSETTHTYDLRWMYSPPGTPVLVHEMPLESGHENMVDVVTPGFYKKIREGEIINNPMTYAGSSQENPAGGTAFFPQQSWPYTRHLQTNGVAGNQSRAWLHRNPTLLGLYDADPLDGIDIEQDLRTARNTALARVDATPHDFFEDLLEIRETIKFLRNPLSAIQGVKRAFSRKKLRAGKIKNHGERAKALADLYNQYRFALAPLIRSIVEAVQAYNDRDRTRRPARRKARYALEYPISDTSQNYNGMPTPFWTYSATCNCNVTEKVTVSVRAAILYEVTNPLKNWAFHLGLRVKDLPTTAWEIVPLSFMVDRLINLKNSISGLVNLLDPNVTILAASYTSKVNAEKTFTVTNAAVPGFGSPQWNPDTCKKKSFSYERTDWAPGVSDLYPGFTPANVVKDISSIADLIALTIVRLPL
jgi:hypothetical protein